MHRGKVPATGAASADAGLLRGLLSPVERKNGWQLAEQAGDATPDGLQCLLPTYRWDENLVRDDLVGYVAEHLAGADGVLVVYETWFLKKGVSRQGCSVTTAARRGGARNLRLEYFWPTPAARAERCWTGSCTCPRYSQRIGGVAGRRGRRRRSAFRPSRSWRGSCLSVRLNRKSPSPGLPGMRYTAATGTLGYGWRGLMYRTCWPSRRVRSCGPWRKSGPVWCSAGNGAKGPRVYD